MKRKKREYWKERELEDSLWWRILGGIIDFFWFWR
jgi:hypothetical protein